MHNNIVIIIDFGGQYKELIARRLRELGVNSFIIPNNNAIDIIQTKKPAGIIMSGGPMSVFDKDSPKCTNELFELGIPVLAICYGMQLMCHKLGGHVIKGENSEFGQTKVQIDTSSALFTGLSLNETCLMSHTDRVDEVPNGFSVSATTPSCAVAAFSNCDKNLYGVQFHPEAELTVNGRTILSNFVFNICDIERTTYSTKDFIHQQIDTIKEQVGTNKVILGLSGGVDSSVCAALISEAVKDKLICIFIDHGMMRKNEAEEVEQEFSKKELTFIRIDASKRFLEKLKGITDPEIKRKIIGKEFVDVFSEEASKYAGDTLLAQGTIYPDIVESGANGSAVIKSHHNVGGLPENMNFIGLVEPLRTLFKDEVRQVGRSLGLSSKLIDRQPFPGPGLAVRCIGEITSEKLSILKDADLIFREEIEKSNLRPSQYFAIITDNRSVGVMGDFRTYDYTIALRAIDTNDFMTALYTPIPHELLSKVSVRITNEVKGVNRVVYDITSKPPATVEWE